MVDVEHDGSRPGDVMENCCKCGQPTRYWYGTGARNVALCQTCASQVDRDDLPTKKEWCEYERNRKRNPEAYKAGGGASDVERVVRRVVTPTEAMAVLSAAMQEDSGYAWSWHCNIAMVAQDAGAPHKEANERAADFMRRAFGVDTSLPPNARVQPP